MSNKPGFLKKELPTLATILHDPEDRQLPVAKKLWGELLQYYSAICVSASDKVSPEFIDFLTTGGAQVRQSDRGIGAGRRESVSMALDQESDYIQYCDFDRILHWVANYPQELPLVASVIKNSDFLILGRTERAFGLHPKVQQVTEDITNSAFSLVFGRTVDVTAGSSGMNRKTAQIILSNSKSDINDTDTEWPIIAIEHEMKVNVIFLEGLEFETDDYYQDQIDEAGSLEQWLLLTYDHPDMWKYRIKMTQKSVERIIDYAKRSGNIR